MGTQSIKREQPPLWKRAVNFMLVAVLLFSVIGSPQPQTAQASQPVGDVIHNYPYSPAPSMTPTNPTDIDWNYRVDHTDPNQKGLGLSGPDTPLQGYEQAYTEALSEQYNGTATPNHMVISNDPVTEGTIAFYGYGIMPYMDYAFTSTSSAMTRGLSFVLNPANMNFHTLSETGYLFNGQMTKVGSNTYYTGYAITLSCANDAGMQENDATSPNTAALRVYYINNELWNTEDFKPGNTTNTRTLVATIKTDITNLSTTAFRTSVEIDPATRAFKVYVDGVCWASVDASQVIGGASGPKGFGFYTGYYAHNCAILTRIRYEYISIISASGSMDDAVPANCQVNFVEQATGNEIRIPETEVGLVNQGYRIVQPQKISFEGKMYYLVSNSAGTNTRSDIKLGYKADPSQNVTTLYYMLPEDLTTKAPEKNAQVNGGDWDTGTSTKPVQVTAGSEINYNITAYAPSTAVPMLMRGNSAAGTDTTWWNQATTGRTPDGSPAPAVQKQQIATIKFVNLTSYLSPSVAVIQFLDENPTWNGKPVLKAWDATDTTMSNPDQSVQRVIAWVTAGSVAGTYDLYVGGQNGVWMSCGDGTSSTDQYSYQFQNFTNVSTIDFAAFHTERARNMRYMFSSLGSSLTTAPSLDLSNFDTSNVVDMSYMFNQYAYGSTTPPTLDLSHFDTSNVQFMGSMFYLYAYSSLTGPTLDLSSFDTAKVTDMSSMFFGFARSAKTPPTVDLTHFNTAKALNMSSMFSNYAYSVAGATPVSLDLTHFDTSSATNMGSMFSSFAYYSTTPPQLDLTHFNTSNVTNMSSMFSNYAYTATTPPTLDLSRFNTVKVTNMNNMFNGYAYSSASPVTLDLRWFKIGVPAAGTTLQQMFSNTSHVTQIYLNSVDFNAATIPNSNNMFLNQSMSLNVYVGTAADRTWMMALSPAPPTVTVQAPTGSQLAPEPVTLIAPVPVVKTGSSVPQTVIVDTIPSGLTIDESSITGDKNTVTQDDAITWTRDGQTITWSVPNTMVPVDVSVKVKVNSGLTDGTPFTNMAIVGPQNTNATYHKFKAGWNVTEQYYVYHGGPTTTQLQDDANTIVDPGGSYTAIGPLTSLSGYSYYGYQRVGIDSTVQTGPPPAPAYTDASPAVHGSGFASSNAETIKLYYTKDAMTVTVHYVDETGNEIASPTVVGVTPNTDYYLLNSYFGSITVGSDTYTYYNYAANADKSVKDQAMPAPALAPSTSPVYPDGSVPTFTATQMTSDKDVTLYFTKKKAVTVHYVEKGNPSHILHPDATYFVDSTYNAASAVISSLNDSATSKTYTYTSTYSLDSGASASAGTPGTVTAPADITLYYSTNYTVTEKYHVAYNPEEDDAPTVLAPDKDTSVASGDPFYSTGPPASINGYSYVGYKIGNDSAPLQEGYPSSLIPLIPSVFDDQNIIYVYEKSILTVTYVDFDGSVITTETVGYGEDATPPTDPTRPGYRFTGWDK
ncbi:MAG: BspA family leucine-rich repeat surface protein, partial [Coriobacteriia bacterium]|nr:BspA family leucine-rich repeat surface protein [Coriobacteriia bacterium]